MAERGESRIGERAAAGNAVRRREDGRLLTGAGRFLDDIVLPRQLRACFLRSPHAHATIRRIDCAAAMAHPGVAAVLTGRDVRALGVGSLPCVMRPPPKAGTRLAYPPRWPLAVDRVRHVGEPVAMVVAETIAIAKDALDLIDVDYEPLPAVVDAAAAAGPGAPRLHDDAPGNLCVRWCAGDEAAVRDAFARADHVTRLEIRNNRLVMAPLETRGAIGDFDAGGGRFTLYTGCQGVHDLRRILAEDVLGVAETRIRVVTDDVGGSFGMKMYLYPEQVMVLVAARRLGRPVKWIGERGESFVSDNQGRDQVSRGELALSAAGAILGLRVGSRANMGAYLSGFGPFIPTEVGMRALVGPYRTPAVYVEVDCLFTNTVPVDAYRGAGRSEAVFIIERLLDAAAREMRIDRLDLRRRNLIAAGAMPYATPLGFAYDDGDFAATLAEAVRLARWDGFEKRRGEAAARGRLRGIGLCTYVEPCSGARDQQIGLRFHPDGTVTVLAGSQSTGMGHETVYAQMVAERLGVPMDAVRVMQGDSDAVPFGRWTSGSRTMAVGGSALGQALDRVVGKARRLAAHLLGAAAEELVFADGAFAVQGTNRRIGFAETATAAFDPRRLPAGMEPGLDAAADYVPAAGTFPNGCHVCELEIDPETGAVGIVRFVAVDDFGRVVNPMLVEGQVHGGLAQGIGQALFERCVYDAASGQLLSGSFADYCLPRADDLPSFTVARTEVPCRTNPLGVKGCGEAGAVGAPPAVVNALVDALSPLGVTDIEMPATPERVWMAIRGAGAAAPRAAVAKEIRA